MMRMREKAMFAGFALLFFGGLFWWGSRAYLRYTVVVPAAGGEFREAIVGSPRYLNPVLADTTEAEAAIEALVFSSLFRPDGRGGIEPDLADGYTVSEDRKEYFVTLRDGVTWHDGAPLTADDVLFTIALIKNQSLRSPLAFAWQGADAEKISDRTIKFVLAAPYEYFLQNLTFRVLPQHLWAQVPIENFHLAELNVRPIGSGPYRFRSFERDQVGTITSYTFSANPDYFRGRPYIDTVRLKFYKTADEALLGWKKGEVDAFGGLQAADAAAFSRAGIRQIRTSRQFSVFFNTDSSVLADRRVREALVRSVDLAAFGALVLKGGGRVEEPAAAYDVGEAIALLEKSGWKDMNNDGIRMKGAGRNRRALAAELAIPAGDLHQRTAEFLKEAWRGIGMDLRISVLDASAISALIRSRNYDMTLFGTLFGPEPDLYPFWHSSQIDYPGLNLSRLELKKLDTVLERLRKEPSAEKRAALRSEAASLIRESFSSLTLYSPYYFYLLSPRIHPASAPEVIGAPEERFGRIYEWFIMTGRKWRR
jgi:peptide/nickel transport system substrate-binding protein